MSKQKMQMIQATGAGAAHLQAGIQDDKQPLTKFHELVFAKLNGEDYPG